jgi:hypothetical protein
VGGFGGKIGYFRDKGELLREGMHLRIQNLRVRRISKKLALGAAISRVTPRTYKERHVVMLIGMRHTKI